MTIKELYEEEKKKNSPYGKNYRVKLLGGKRYKVKGQIITIVHYSVRNDCSKTFQSDTPVHYTHRMAVHVKDKPVTSIITRSWWAKK